MTTPDTPTDAEAGTPPWLGPVMHIGFYLLLAASAARFVAHHGWHGATGTVVGLVAALALAYAVGTVLPENHRVRLGWLAVVVVLWLALVVVAPSFGICAVPLFFVALPLLSTRATIALAAVLTAAVIVAQVRLGVRLDASVVLTPVAVAGITVAVYAALAAQTRRQRRLIADLLAARDALATAERTAGVLGERARLAREIHDSLAQGFSSTRMLVQAAQRSADSDPAAARRYLALAEEATADNLAEARRVINDLAPADLDTAGSLPEALRELASRTGAGTGLAVTVRVDGTEWPLAPRVAAALLRVAQGALANVREHAQARTAVLTLSYVDNGTTLDVYDDGVGFDPAGARPDGVRGQGLRLARNRLAEIGGTLVVESGAGRGTVVAASVPDAR
ncbi:sensor histidine kinase [Actinocatenispora rupis]|uniref:Two-component sensor histidine kinase n=1 Tax=Actinocatenispora rupis TaxID=519421 RepID=A0A8J3J7V5_9ACTN|nr:sensor histidine kinase [Actinocatenispora rupis]GID11739.1 two-component sensor histidine kinase [Actinocatenispora rupis]